MDSHHIGIFESAGHMVGRDPKGLVAGSVAQLDTTEDVPASTDVVPEVMRLLRKLEV